MSAKPLRSKRPRQQIMSLVADVDESTADELFPAVVEYEPPPPEEQYAEANARRQRLMGIVGAMRLEAIGSGTAMRHLKSGCSMRYSMRDQHRSLVVWRTDNVPSASELKTLREVFEIPIDVEYVWQFRGSQKVAAYYWHVVERAASAVSAGEPTKATRVQTGQVGEDYRTMDQIAALIDVGQFREARALVWRIHGNLVQTDMLDAVIAAEDAAKKVVKESSNDE